MNNFVQKKICLLGDFSTGKTCLVRRFVHDLFDDRYLSTIGVNIHSKQVHLTAENSLNLIIWDLEGGNGFKAMRSSYLRGAAGALLVCDLTRPATLANLESYFVDLQETAPQAPVVVIGNKYDLVEPEDGRARQVASQAASFNAPYCITSAKTGDHVEQAFVRLAKLIMNPLPGPA